MVPQEIVNWPDNIDFASGALEALGWPWANLTCLVLAQGQPGVSPGPGQPAQLAQSLSNMLNARPKSPELLDSFY